ncbi:MAG: PatB family C-S lyase [Halanaerobium sp.]|nr:PatB family C-S lyase [Halanaerobium sp.]
MSYSFADFIDRRGTDSAKWDGRKDKVGRDDILPLWVADADWNTAPVISAAIQDRAEHKIYGYTKPGPEHDQAVVGWLSRRYGWQIRPEWITYTSGIVPALHLAVQLLSEKGEAVVLQSPVYRPFFQAIAENGRVLLNNQLLFDGSSYRIDFADLEAKLAREETRLMILCSPHNPVGRVWTEEELSRMGELCLANDVVIISDEIHADLTFSGHRHIPLASLSEELAARTITLYSPSKTFNVAGLYASAAVIPHQGMREEFIKKAHGMIASVSLFGLTAIKAAYSAGDSWLDAQLDYLQVSMEYTLDFVERNIPGVKVHQPDGTYLLWLDFRDILPDPDSLEEFLLEEARVGLVNGSWFGPGGAGFMRLNMACPRETLQEALERIARAVKREKKSPAG